MCVQPEGALYSYCLNTVLFKQLTVKYFLSLSAISNEEKLWL